MVVTTIGFLKEAPDVNIHGFNVYHKNRLILVSSLSLFVHIFLTYSILSFLLLPHFNHYRPFLFPFDVFLGIPFFLIDILALCWKMGMVLINQYSSWSFLHDQTSICFFSVSDFTISCHLSIGPYILVKDWILVLFMYIFLWYRDEDIFNQNIF